ncbi:GNAT family N-acetyltransferase [Actinoplanes sp. LDG1-06]|uniref:GNAT family N-acetyltransferase n=1 Tax=Paractinoplanes ovalisporus TaxID=2810368 RepID=A0ABS2A8G9_9ACTN|nr:GNAT family N-acetyltransferase [Actinoplanes ovalisporus]MBM2616120.1 GNAT family N-acetyltransferase [Actinoplanes ovalisporus]
MITVARPEDRPAIVGALVAAFVNDPVLRHLFPDDTTYPAYAEAFFGVCFDKRVDRRTVWTIQQGAATAIWEPPDVDHPSDNLAAELPEAELKRVRQYDEAVHAALPAGPFWYLGVLGTHPDFTGRRWAQAVMHAGLDRAAADGLPAVLETSNPANVEFYRRAGWQVVNEISDPLPVWVMQR